MDFNSKFNHQIPFKLHIKNKNLTFLNQEAIANSFLEKDIDVKFN